MGFEHILPIDRPVDVVELAAAVGGGAETGGEEAAGRDWFLKGRLVQRGFDPSECVLIRVLGESMSPTLRSGCRILVHRGRTRLEQERIFVLRTDNGLIVNRVKQGPGGDWILSYDQVSWPDVPWPTDAETFGQVVWTGRFLV